MGLQTKQINAVMPEKIHEAVSKVKDQYGDNWPIFILRGAAALDDKEILDKELEHSVEELLASNLEIEDSEDTEE